MYQMIEITLWLAKIMHLVAEITHWVTKITHWVAEIMHWLTEITHWVAKITHWLAEIIYWVAEITHWAAKITVWVAGITVSESNQRCQIWNHPFNHQFRNLEFQITISNCEIIIFLSKILTCRIERYNKNHRFIPQNHTFIASNQFFGG